MVRYADDFVVGFEQREDAERFQAELPMRLAKFGLELQTDKTRLIAFGREADRAWRSGQGEKPGTFNFLGFTHECGKTRKGKFIVRRQTRRKRMRTKLAEVKGELRRRMHQSIPEQGAYLRSVIAGYYRYHGVPLNLQALVTFREAVTRLWHHSLRRRSQKHRLTWQRLARYTRRWFPPVRICHPYPWERLRVTT